MSNNIFKLYDGEIEIKLPDDFVEMTEKEKYFNGSTPDYVFAVEKTNSLISVTTANTENTNLKLEEEINKYITLYRRIIPNFSNCKAARKTVKSGEEIGAFYFTSTLPDKDMFNLMAIICLEKKEVVITMHCELKDAVELALRYMEVLENIVLLH